MSLTSHTLIVLGALTSHTMLGLGGSNLFTEVINLHRDSLRIEVLISDKGSLY